MSDTSDQVALQELLELLKSAKDAAARIHAPTRMREPDFVTDEGKCMKHLEIGGERVVVPLHRPIGGIIVLDDDLAKMLAKRDRDLKENKKKTRGSSSSSRLSTRTSSNIRGNVGTLNDERAALATGGAQEAEHTAARERRGISSNIRGNVETLATGRGSSSSSPLSTRTSSDIRGNVGTLNDERAALATGGAQEAEHTAARERRGTSGNIRGDLWTVDEEQNMWILLDDDSAVEREGQEEEEEAVEKGERYDDAVGEATVEDEGRDEAVGKEEAVEYDEKWRVLRDFAAEVVAEMFNQLDAMDKPDAFPITDTVLTSVFTELSTSALNNISCASPEGLEDEDLVCLSDANSEVLSKYNSSQPARECRALIFKRLRRLKVQSLQEMGYSGSQARDAFRTKESKSKRNRNKTLKQRERKKARKDSEHQVIVEGVPQLPRLSVALKEHQVCIEGLKRKLVVVVTALDTGMKLKEKITAATNIPTEELTLRKNSKLVQDNLRIDKQDIKSGDTLRCHAGRGLGGSNSPVDEAGQEEAVEGDGEDSDVQQGEDQAGQEEAVEGNGVHDEDEDDEDSGGVIDIEKDDIYQERFPRE